MEISLNKVPRINQFEITQELDIESMVGDGGIENLLNGDNMMNIFKTINEKIENKVGEDSAVKNNLMGEAGNICDTMKDNPLFSTLMGEEVAPRREFIVSKANLVSNLDI